MIVTIVTFNLAEPATLGEITKVFQGTVRKYQGVLGLLRKNYWMSEDGRRAGGIYVWASRADADRMYTPEWKKFVEGKYGSPAVVGWLACSEGFGMVGTAYLSTEYAVKGYADSPTTAHRGNVG